MVDNRNNTLHSVLAVDFGSVNTRLILIDLVDGQFRLVTSTQTRTTLNPPIGDVTIGLSRAIANLEEITDRPMINDEGGLIIPEEDSGGIDELVATSSAGRPLRAVLVGLMRDVSLASARRALTSSYIQITDILSYTDTHDIEECINIILRSDPDLIFVSGGTDGGDEEAVRFLISAVALAVKLVDRNERPLVLYAGNHQLADEVRAQLQDVTSTFISKNIHPELDEEKPDSVRSELTRVYGDFMSQQPGGFHEIASFSNVGLIPTAQSVSNVIRWLGQLLTGSPGALHIDVGSRTSTLAIGTQQDVHAAIHSDLGVGHSLLATLELLDPEFIMRWLPFDYSTEQLRTYAHNKDLNPNTIPHLEADLLIEQALGREIVRYMLDEMRTGWEDVPKTGTLPTYQPVIFAGATFTQIPHPGIAALLVLDALEIEGYTTLYIDPFGVVSALGATAYLDPLVTVQVFENRSLTKLGPVFCPSGRGQMRIKLTLPDDRVIDKRLKAGEIWAAPVDPEQEVQVDIRLGRGMKINGKRRFKQRVSAGAAGLVFDNRGRPLTLPQPAQRAEVYAAWRSGVTGMPAPKWGERFATMLDPELADKSGREIRRERLALERELDEIIEAAAHMSKDDEPDLELFGLEEETAKKSRRKKRRADKKRRRGKAAAPDTSQVEPEEDEVVDILDRL